MPMIPGLPNLRPAHLGLWLAALLVLLTANPARAEGEAVGILTEMVGTVRLLRGDSYLEVQRGVEVHPQDIVETGTNGSAQLDLKDGSVLKLGPGSRLALSDYKLDKNRNVVSASLDILTGWLRFAVSKLRKDDSKYRINAPSLTIGIRGTEGVVEAGNREGGVHLVTGRIEVGGLDAQGKPLPPVQVNAGEYIQRLQGQAFRRLPTPPPAFINRVPRDVVFKLAARPLKPGEQPVIKPRVVRQLTRTEAQQIIQRHPHAQEILKRRFQPLLNPGAPDARLKGPTRPDGAPPVVSPIPGGIGGQIPPGRLTPVFQPPGDAKPVPPNQRLLPGTLSPPTPPGVPVPYPNVRPGVTPPKTKAVPGPSGVLPAKPGLAAPVGGVPAGTPAKKKDGQDTDASGQPDSSSATPPPHKPSAAPNHPPPRKVIRMMMRH